MLPILAGQTEIPVNIIYDGGKAYWASRVFHYQFGTWQMAESFHNTIQASGVMTEVEGK